MNAYEVIIIINCCNLQNKMPTIFIFNTLRHQVITILYNRIMSKLSGKKSLEQLFVSPYKELISHGLPLLFSQEQIKHSRGGRVGMEVGNARERVLISLCMFVFGKENVEIPPTTSTEEDLSVYGNPISIKTKTGNSNSGIKIKWTTDWDKVDDIVDNYNPVCDLLLTKIVWGGSSGLYWVPVNVQRKILKQMGRDKYIKTPPRNTNPRGVEFSKEAMTRMLAASGTKELIIEWDKPDKALETQINNEYIAKWQQIAKKGKL